MYSTHLALNKLDWSLSEVDPQTKLFIYNVALIELYSNHLQGPNMILGIRHNSSSDIDYGFGRTWELALTRLEGNVLCMSDGRKFPLQQDGKLAPNLTIRDFKLDHSIPNQTIINHTSGVRETLNELGLLVKTETPDGRYLTFTWLNPNFQTFLLSHIDDMQKKPIVTIFYSESPKTVQIRHAACNINLFLSDVSKAYFKLDSISIAEAKELSASGVETFRFEYDIAKKNTVPLISVETHGGKREKIKIHYEQSELNDNNSAFVPQVESIDRFISDTKLVKTEWIADKGSFVKPVQVKFANYTVVNLGYQISEISSNIKIIRQYNESHQLICEALMEDGKNFETARECQWTIFTYEMPDDFSPTKIMQFEKRGDTIYQGLSESFTYNMDKVKSHSNVEMMLTEYVYSADAEAGGYVYADNFLYLRNETLSNLSSLDASITADKNSQRVKTHEYKLLTGIGEFRHCMLKKSITENQVGSDGSESLRSKIRFEYFEDLIWFGCVKSTNEIRTEDGYSRSVIYRYNLTNDRTLTITENKAIDKTRIDTRNKTFDTSTGLLQQEEINGEITTFTYDLYKRLKTKTITYDDRPSNITYSVTYEYGEDNSVTAHENSGLSLVKDYDFNSALVGRRFLYKNKSYPVERNTYDDFGDLIDEKIGIFKFDDMAVSTTNNQTINIQNTYNLYGDLKKKTTYKSNTGVLYKCREEIYSYPQPFSSHEVKVNSKLRTLITKIVGTNRSNRVLMSSLIGGSSFVGMDETTYYDCFNRPAVVKEHSKITTNSYDRFDQVTLEIITNGAGDIRYSKKNYIFDVGISPFAAAPSGVNVNSITDNYTMHDPQGRPLIIYAKGQALVYNYTDSTKPMLATISTKVAISLSKLNEDPMSIIEKLTQPGRMCKHYSYDMAGRLKKTIYKDNGTLGKANFEVDVHYDNYGNMTECSRYETGVLASHSTVAYTYDVLGNILTETSHAGSTTYTWMTDGLISSASFTLSGSIYKEEYLYEAGLLTEMEIRIGEVKVVAVKYVRDSQNLDQLQSVDYSFNLPGKPTCVIKKTDFIYDEVGRALGYKLILHGIKDTQIYSVNWALDGKDRVTQVHTINYSEESFSEHYRYNYEGKLSTWIGDGQAMLGRDAYNNKIIRAEFSYTAQSELDVRIYTDSARRKFASKNSYFNGQIVSANYIDSDGSDIYSGTPNGAPKEINYIYDNNPKLPNGSLTYGELQSVLLLDDSTARVVHYTSNGYVIASVGHSQFTKPGYNGEVTTSSISKTLTYDALERIIFTTDVSGFAQVPGDVRELNKVQIVNQYALDKLKIVTYNVENVQSSSFDLAARQIHQYFNDSVDFTLSFDRDGHSSGFELLITLPNGTPIASAKTAPNDNDAALIVEEYSRSPTGDTFVVHSAFISKN